MAGPLIGIVGGGFTGAAVAVHLARLLPADAGLFIVEPREQIGGGLAYGSCAAEHRINVPSDRRNVFGDDPTHFTKWLERTGRFAGDPEALTPAGHHYSRRRDFGDYMSALVQGAAKDVALRHVRGVALGISRRDGAFQIDISDKRGERCDAVVITASHAAPACPWPVPDELTGNPGIVLDPWQPGALDEVEPDARVIVAGTGLTMCDVLVSLRLRGHRGQVLALSRRALLPRVQDGFHDGFELLADQPLPTTARDLLRLVRRGVDTASAVGLDWRTALDATRRELPRLWPSLTLDERRRVVRWLRPWWDVHRFRMAPQVHRLLEGGQRCGWLQVERGRIGHLEADASGRISVAWKSIDGPQRRSSCDVFVNCTGPDSDLRRSPNSLFRSLLDAGYGRADPLRLGLDTDTAGRLRNRAGEYEPFLRAAGPLAKAAVGEVTGVPEASSHALSVATDLATSLRRQWLHSREATKFQ